ncbi:MAG: ABC transporter substrate-binding protein [Dehalococcoidia bacterium]|nr:ABC transporter substrate-binding protein [Dehalococcoidia bacterium]
MRQTPRGIYKRICVLMLGVVMAALLAACATPAAPTAAPTKAPAAAPTTAAAAVSSPAAPAPTTASAPAAASPTAAPKPTTAAAVAPTGTPIKIGFLTPLTGASASFGALETVTMALAEADVNAAGGINGHPLQIIRYDSPFDPTQAVSQVRKLEGTDKVFAILGPYSSGEMDVAAPLANELKVPVIGMKTTKPGFSENNRPWEFRFTVTDDISTPAEIAAYKKAHPEVKSVVVAGDTKNAVSAFMVSDVWPKYLKEANLNIVATVGYDSGTTDFSAIITKLKSYNADGIAYSSPPPGNPVGFAKELAAQQNKAPVVVSPHFVPGLFAYQAGAAMEGWIGGSFFDPTKPDAKVQDFLKRWQAKADADPNVTKPATLTLEANDYDVVMILADIMRKANILPETPLTDARTKIRDGLAAVKGYNGLSGVINMGANGDATWPATIVIAKNGKWEVVK